MIDIDPTARVLLRLRLADRPGALGTVAGRIGAVRGDLVGIDILERAGAHVVDELLVDLPSADLLELLVRELGELEEVDVELAMPVEGLHHDPGLEAFDVAAVLVGAQTTDELSWALCSHLRRAIRCDWVCVVEGTGAVAAHAGAVPDSQTLETVVVGDGDDGQPRIAGTTLGADHLSWIPLPVASAALVIGRRESPLRAVERHRAAALCRVAGAWYGRLVEQRRLRSMLAHPSGGNRHQERSTPVPDDASALVDHR